MFSGQCLPSAPDLPSQTHNLGSCFVTRLNQRRVLASNLGLGHQNSTKPHLLTIHAPPILAAFRVHTCVIWVCCNPYDANTLYHQARQCNTPGIEHSDRRNKEEWQSLARASKLTLIQIRSILFVVQAYSRRCIVVSTLVGFRLCQGKCKLICILF